MRSLSKIVKAHAVVLDEEKYKLSPLILKAPKEEDEEMEVDENPLLAHADHIVSEDEEETALEAHEQFNLDEVLDDAKRQADEIINSAQEEHDRVVKDAYDNAMEIMENAKSEGFSTGYKEGYDQGYQEGYGASEVLIDEANELKHNATLHYEQIIQNSEGQLMDLVMEITQKVLEKEMDDDDEIIFNLVKKGLGRLTQTELLKIRVSEADYINLVSMKKRILPLLDKVGDIQIVQDDNMSKGDCIMETDSGNIDSGVQTQLDYIKTAFEALLQSE
jgi:flagellar assembly protein FliH